ncbi:MAG TPA: hypothetical protein VEC37_16305 [Bacillota bacterium]|nr:hypothetical protein [Bacillota bacterium]
MRQLTPGEKLALSTLLQAETNGLAMARAGINVITDEQLKALASAGITASEARIAGLQEFISENHLTVVEEVH